MMSKTKEILRSVKIIEEDGKFILDKHYKYELSLDKIKEYKKNIQDQINTCKTELQKITEEKLEEGCKLLIKKCEHEYAVKKTALLNFKKYQSEAIINFKQKAEEERKMLLEFCNKDVFDKYKEIVIKRFLEDASTKKLNYQIQIKEQSEDIKTYEKY